MLNSAITRLHRVSPNRDRSTIRPWCIELQIPDDSPVELPVEPEEPGEPDEADFPCTDDAYWDVFIPDDDNDPLPERGDFWIEDPNDLAFQRPSASDVCE
jgi:hypothetical protein